MHILDKMKKNLPAADYSGPFDAMVEDIRGKAVAEAKEGIKSEVQLVRIEMQSLRNELVEARGMISQRTSERDGAKTMYAKLEQSYGVMEKKEKQLTAAISLEQKAGRDALDVANQMITELQVSIGGVRSQVKILESEQTRLRKKADKKPPAVKPQIIQKSIKIPDFTIDNVVRGGPKDRIISATIKPVRAT